MRIAIVKLSAMGDIIHAMIVLQYIKSFNQKITIDWIVEESFKDLLKFNLHVNKIHLVNFKDAKKNKSILALFKEFNKLRNHDFYDLVIDMQGLLKSAIVSKLLPSKQIVGFDKFSAREKISSIFYHKTFRCSYETNVIERNLALIGYALDVNFKKEDIQNKAPFLFSQVSTLNIPISESKKNILIIPGASHITKRYPAIKLAEIANVIDANFYVIWGNSEEKILAKKIKELSPNVHICNKLSIDSLILLISKMRLVIGPDTGPTHIAWGLNIPSITLFGPTPGYRNSFESSVNKILESDSRVNPTEINKADYSIKNIDLQKILSTAKELLK